MHILLVEDNEGDIELTNIAFRKVKGTVSFSVAHDGVEAMEFLHRQGVHGDATRPDLILLDLNMPRMGGRQFLETIKEHKNLKQIPVIVLTSSSAPADIADSYQRHANCYIPKPFNYEKFVAMAQQVYDYWTGLARIPGVTPSA